MPPELTREKISPNQQWLDRIAAKAAELLKQSPNPQREMTWAERRLEESSLFEGNRPRTDNPSIWTEQVIAQNPDLMDQSIPWLKERASHPEEAETFEQLILQLIPQEGGL